MCCFANAVRVAIWCVHIWSLFLLAASTHSRQSWPDNVHWTIITLNITVHPYFPITIFSYMWHIKYRPYHIYFFFFCIHMSIICFFLSLPPSLAQCSISMNIPWHFSNFFVCVMCVFVRGGSYLFSDPYRRIWIWSRRCTTTDNNMVDIVRFAAQQKYLGRIDVFPELFTNGRTFDCCRGEGQKFAY